jgi:hypothetical protein
MGSSVFLFLWGLSSFALARKWSMAALFATGFAGLFCVQYGQGATSLAGMAMMALGAGMLFPMAVVRAPSGLIHFFAADTFGGLFGCILGIWLPVFSGYRGFYTMMPWAWLAAFLATGLTIFYGRRLPGGPRDGPIRDDLSAARH